jgi:hypothetical protein
MDAAVDLALQETSGFKYTDVFRNGGEGHTERFGQFCNHGCAARQARENGSARWVG